MDATSARGQDSPPVVRSSRLHVGRQLLLALGPGGTLLAIVAGFVGIACSAVVAVTLVQSIATTHVKESQDREARVVALRKANTRLMQSIEGLTSGYVVAQAGQFPAREAWNDFYRSLLTNCSALSEIIADIDHLRSTCLAPDELRAFVEPAIFAFEPPARPLSLPVLRRLQKLRVDIVALADQVFVRTGELEEELTADYAKGQQVLAASALGFALSALVLLYLVWLASVRHAAKAQEAELQHEEHQRAQEALIEQACYDGLTHLYNRTYFLERAREAIADAVLNGRRFAMLCLDVDGFKDVNSTMGYTVGDGLLETVAERLKGVVGKRDLVARFGADEFTIFHVEEEGADSESLVRDLIAVLERPYELKGTVIRSGACIGASVCDVQPIRPETVVGQADMALHRAKAKGPNSSYFFTRALDQEVRERVELAQEMREALVNGQFFLLYHPRIDAVDGRPTGVEALLRWRHPTKGVLLPSSIISIAESTGLIQEIGLWVMAEACRQMRLWIDAGLEIGRMAVNVSAHQFKVPAELELGIERALSEVNLPPDRLELELTETALMGMTREHNEVLERLRSRGVTIAIDDFGTGYSSLAYLRHLPVDRVKIAQEFVQRIGVDDADTTITRFAVHLVLTLGLEVVAEGVETPQQLTELKLWGCREVQGYLFSKPIPADELASFLATWRSEPQNAP